ncbi:Dipeptidyl aminopeptidase/acylaminoacyl peptidase [Colwellia chukchiensis]|uniref:Dipeptidyl aminopeptidase/acylaminoacyl peptidase n=1 Tax=Colwellia chukchiensis TaxID=641665 RepID=A0A1H7GHN6_9GAMM|nr:alpha/beta fold hydrolase [Colwellia chukchiensis]SEK37683.1 Dipeptidyl aminopeptidase/acylaminoacyl peptidase [Colwellia chukchiensis]
MKAIYLSLLLVLSITSAQAEDWAHLFERKKYQAVKISPDGKHIAAVMDANGKRALIFINRKTMKMSGSTTLPGKNEVGSYFWANNERVVIKIHQREPWLEQLQFYGELFAVNIDGSAGELIYGYRNVDTDLGHRLKKKKKIDGWADVIDILPDDKRNILISSTPWGSTISGLYKLNIYNGKVKKLVIGAPVPYASYITDTKGDVMALTGLSDQYRKEVHVRKGDQWQKLPSDKYGSNFKALTLDDSGDNLLVLDNFKQDKRGLFKLNLHTGEMQPIISDNKSDITQIKLTSDEKNIYAVATSNGFPSYYLIDKELKETQVFKQLVATFPDQSIDITSRTEKGDIYIVRVSSDIEAGRFYIYDLVNNKLSSLFKYYPKVDAKQLAYTDPIEFTSSDGLKIRGYFTQAKKQVKGAIPPTVILVHGGPHDRDNWQYSPTVQYLALNGYSVLQVNFRGSTGYGASFEAAGYGNWGSLIQQDIYEAYQWAINAGLAAKNKACIMGSSFGAYSAIQSAIKYPETYRCAIAYAGVYDLELMFDEGNIQNLRFGKAYLTRTLGADQAIHKSMSPVHHVEQIKIPLMIAHGKKDKQVPFEHAARLISALEQAQKPYVWHKFSSESHGFYNPENQAEYMKNVLAFLNKSII